MQKHEEENSIFEKMMLLFKEDRERFILESQEIDRRFKETDRRFKETDKQFKETAERFKETDKQFKETAERFKETDKQFKETDKKLQKLMDSQEKLNGLVGGLGNNVGYFTEEYFFTSLKKKKKFAGIRFDYVEKNIKFRIQNISDEYDIVLINGDTIGLIETKFRVHKNDLEKLVTKKIENFRFLFPHYKDYRIVLGIGSMSFPDDVLDEAKRLGIGVLQQQGDTIEFYDDNVKFY